LRQRPVQMAPKRGTKRAPSPVHTQEPPNKKIAAALKKHSVTQATYHILVDALSHPLTGLPDQCTKMLLAMLPQSLCVPVDERQEYQQLGVRMIEEVIHKLQEALQKAVDSENEKVAGAEAHQDALAKAVIAADEALAVSQATTAERQSELTTASEAVVAAQTKLTKAEEDQRIGDADLVSARSDKEVLEAALEGDFQMLKSGAYEAGNANTHFNSIKSLFGKLSMDESLKSAGPGALMKNPAERGGFDNTVVAAFEDSFKTKIASLEEVLSSAKPASDARASAVVSSRQEHEEAEEKQKEASNALLAAKESQKEAAAALKAAKAAVTANKPEYKAATELRDEKKAELDTFVDSTISTFNTLKDKISAKKQRELAAAEAQAAEEARGAEEARAAEAAAAEAAQAAAASAADEPMPAASEVGESDH
jgi:trimeric autotransporter adhesin